MKRIFMIVLATGFSSSLYAECETIKECAQEAVEAAMTARSQIELFLPKGAVVAFDAEECPKPYWEEYKPAYGRFVRGIDKHKKPEEQRKPGNLQEDEVKKHNHKYEYRVERHRTKATGGTSVGELHQFPSVAGSATTKDSGGAESRPKNVALLYCVRK